MAASSPKKADLILGLTPSEAKLIILGVVSANGPPKVDMNKLAERGGYKPGSASVLYNKAKRKLFELHGDAANGGTANTADDANPALGPSGDDIGTPATPTPKRTPFRRKRDNATATPAKGTPIETPVRTEVDPETPKPKRQRKTPAKKGRGAAAESNGADGEASQGTAKDNTTTTPRIKPEPNVNVETELNGDDDDPLGAELETELGSDIVKGEYDEMFDGNTMDAAPTTSNA
ncbi:hypothetical protein VTN00DRAFT_3169 [Thermoascus crustaceus]|uniref:uncharacterized protein n=1 Tax=Thermoascus crustaceus TaxID=5088 RepID=UPI0037436CA3